jgi:DNA-binding NarL/FixJ family response regulator
MTTLAPSPESESQSRRRILIYSEFRVLLDALHGALGEDFEVGTVYDRDAFLSAVADIDADAAVVGLDTSVQDSLEALKVTLGRRPNLPVMLLSTSGISVSPGRAGRLGAKAHCDASQPLPQFISCLRRVLDGECLIPKSGQPVSSVTPYSTVRERLTARQVEVLKLIANGGGAKDIANTLGISVRTAEFHRAAIMDRLEIRSTAQLTRYALENGIY